MPGEHCLEHPSGRSRPPAVPLAEELVLLTPALEATVGVVEYDLKPKDGTRRVSIRGVRVEV